MLDHHRKMTQKATGENRSDDVDVTQSLPINSLRRKWSKKCLTFVSQLLTFTPQVPLIHLECVYLYACINMKASQRRLLQWKEHSLPFEQGPDEDNTERIATERG